ncbi:hypothetical protein M4951_07775 [Blastopirellula sp. J2-11]|uniref:DUF6655 family protein n=1 Tax=Blastopirellula sp. J2-11 TaxID=2943192 RepID=UPI0021C9EC43|nr:DUF6655 family protein [Blastopirellula sp. J2-11]UUO08207.1 hypothetical protein M4951_07775 [Blastopirellula sp. J2-11]
MAASFQFFAAIRGGALVVGLLLAAGCGTTSNRTLTEQLVSSHAVDEAIADIDFQPLRDEKVYLDPRYLQNVKGAGFVNAEYITSAIRQQMNAAGCLLQDSAAEADYVVEARIGALGTEGHTVTYGIPSSNAVSSAASLFPTAPPMPTIPEIAFAKKSNTIGGAKIALFAYHRESRQPIWQSGIAQSLGTAKDTWLLGAGPFQGGNIYDRAQFAGSSIGLPNPFRKAEDSPIPVEYDAPFDFRSEHLADTKHESEEAETPMPGGKAEADLVGYEEEKSPDKKPEPLPEKEKSKPLPKQEPEKVTISG